MLFRIFSLSVFQFYDFHFLEFDARGAMPMYFNGVDLKTQNEKPKNCPVEPVLKNLFNGGSRVLPLLASLEWDQIAARSVFFENEMKHIPRDLT